MKIAFCCVAGAAIMLAMPAFSAVHPGKATYERTCKNCHGDQGQGSSTADQFFKTKIPKLSSAYVQQKSDDELKRIINGGRGKMPPVTKSDQMVSPVQPRTLGTPPPSDPHGKKLQPEEVDEVLAYVRTLKK